jgi:hypothetical protein
MLAKPSGGTLNTAPVLGGFVNSAKGADASRQTAKALAKPLGVTPDTATVLRGFFNNFSANDANVPPVK